MSPAQLLLIASGSSVVVLGLLLWWQKKLNLLFSLTKQQRLRMVLLGFINPFVYYLVLFEAYALLPAQEAQPLNYTWALMLTYLSVLILKQRLSWQDIVAGLICYSGVLVISTRGAIWDLEFSNPVGVILALCSTILWALFWIYNTKWAVEPILGLWVNFISGFIFSLAWVLYQGVLVQIPWQGVLSAVYVGVFEMGITFFLWLQAMRLTTQTAKIANLIFLSPFLSLVFIAIFLKEAILPSTLIGLVLIVGGLLLQKSKKKEI
jgi:drug/metabolite transporter (DMT)-like permease